MTPTCRKCHRLIRAGEEFVMGYLPGLLCMTCNGKLYAEADAIDGKENPVNWTVVRP
jgi:hypothetical protein